MNENILELRDLNVTFKTELGEAHILRDVSLDVKRGKFLCIVGESGCGKSVTTQAIIQLLPDNGRISGGRIDFYQTSDSRPLHLNELEQFGSSMRAIRGAQIGMIFQDTLSSLNPAHKVGRQVAEVLREHKKLTKRQARAEVIELFKKLGISDPERRYDAYPHEFSGGMRQRVMIAIATICEPELLIADEPTTALDVTIQAQILRVLKDLQEQEKKSFILITHNMGLVSEVADEVAVMYLGRIVEKGSVTEVLRNPKHPYTKALLESVPSLLADKEQRLNVIGGQTPTPFEVRQGCEFATRCPHVMEQCRTSSIPLQKFSNSHEVRCLRLDESGKFLDLLEGAR